jgi:predicted phage terminase large subunit-like protein
MLDLSKKVNKKAKVKAKLKDTTSILATILRVDFKAFSRKAFHYLNPGKEFHNSWAVECIAHHLQRCVVAGLKRLIITVPPRHLKSHMASVSLPAWILGRNADHRVICVSYSQDLARKFHQDCHHLIESEFYQETFPGTHLADKPNNDQEYATTAHGFRLATSVGGTLTGRGGDFIIIDDPIKPSDAQSEAERKKLHNWFGDTLISRLDNPSKGVLIIVTQRTHVDDLVGHVKDKGDWTVVNIPAIGEIEETYEIGPDETYVRKPGTVIDSNHQTLEDFKSIEKTMTPFFFTAQYQQQPVVLGGDVIKFSWLVREDQMPPRGAYDFMAQVYDTASNSAETNDYSVCGTFGVIKNDYYLLDIFRGRVGYTELKDRAFALGRRWKPHIILVENSGVGPALKADISARFALVFTQTPQDSKNKRILQQMHKLAGGQLHIPAVASWIPPLKEELTQFPYGKHDDQIDVIEAFLRCVDQLRRKLVTNGHPTAGSKFPDGLPGVPIVKCTVIRSASDPW